MQKDLYTAYEAFEIEFRKMEEKRQNLRAQILADMQKDGNQTVKTGLGTFTVGKKISWSYSPKVEKMEEKLKIAQLNERKRGTAQSSVKEYLLYTDGKTSNS